MRKLLLRSSLILLFLWAAFLTVPHTQSAAPPRPETRLDIVLREWAKATDSVRSMRYRFTKTEYDGVFEKREVTKGEVQILKPDLLRVDLHHSSPRPTVLLITKKTIHFFDPDRKTEQIWEQTAARSFLAETPPLFFGKFWEPLFAEVREVIQHYHCWIFSGLPVCDLTRRFDITLAKEDKYYIYLDFQPRRGQIRSGLEQMRVVLLTESFRVRQIWKRQKNGSETTLDFAEKPDMKATITEESIRKGLPQGWKRFYPLEEPEALQKK